MGVKLRVSHIYAVQEFCDNHSIVETNGMKLQEMIGLPYRQAGRALGELDWELVQIGKKRMRKKNGTQKIFSSMAVKIGRSVLKRYEEHYQKYLEGLELVKKAKELLKDKNFSNTKFLRNKLGISGIRAANLFQKIGWTSYAISSDYTTYKRPGVFED